MPARKSGNTNNTKKQLPVRPMRIRKIIGIIIILLIFAVPLTFSLVSASLGRPGWFDFSLITEEETTNATPDELARIQLRLDTLDEENRRLRRRLADVEDDQSRRFNRLQEQLTGLEQKIENAGPSLSSETLEQIAEFTQNYEQLREQKTQLIRRYLLVEERIRQNLDAEAAVANLLEAAVAFPQVLIAGRELQSLLEKGFVDEQALIAEYQEAMDEMLEAIHAQNRQEEGIIARLTTSLKNVVRVRRVDDIDQLSSPEYELYAAEKAFSVGETGKALALVEAMPAKIPALESWLEKARQRQRVLISLRRLERTVMDSLSGPVLAVN